MGHHTRAQVLAGAGLGSTIAFVWLSIWLGIDGWNQLLGMDLTQYLPNIIKGGLPELALTGLKEPGQLWERVAEDLVWVLLESWRDGNLFATVKEVSHLVMTSKLAGSEL